MAKLKGKEKAAFLRKMARGRNKKRRGHKHSDHHKPKKRRKRREVHMAKRRRRRLGQFVKKARRGARRARSGINRFIPKTEGLVAIGTAYAYGHIEKTADKDGSHFLNQVPALVPRLGRAGNAGALAWVLGVVTRQPTVKAVAQGVLTVAAYQNARGAEFTKDKQGFTMAGGGARLQRDASMVDAWVRQNQG